MELSTILKDLELDLILVQETKLTAGTMPPKFAGYRCLRKDRVQSGGIGGGLAIYLRDHIPTADTTSSVQQLLPSRDQTTELLSCKIKSQGGDLNIVNLYIPPSSSAPGFTPDLQRLSELPNLILGGDVNAHHPLWSPATPDLRGTVVQRDLEDLVLLNDGTPTRIPFSADQQPSAPDLTLCSPHLATDATWYVISATSSDHQLLITDFNTNIGTGTFRRTFQNHRKADWEDFTNTVDQLLQPLNIENLDDPNKTEKVLREAILQAAKKCIPSGHIKNYDPNLSPEILAKIRSRNSLKKKRTKTEEEIRQLQEKNAEIDRMVHNQKKKNWAEFVDSIDLHTTTREAWRKIKTIKDSRCPDPNAPPRIDHDQEVLTDEARAGKLIQHYASVSHLPPEQPARRTYRQVKALKSDPSATAPFTVQQTVKVIQKLSNTSSHGPDLVTNHHLKHLGPKALELLTKTFNLSWQRNIIPSIWKKSIIIPILKPNKPPEDPASYRPISLLSCPSKVLERLILNKIQHAIQPANHQHGYRKGHSTSTHLITLTDFIAKGFNEKPAARSILVALDASKAFDRVPRAKLMDTILSLDLPINDKRWLCSYLSDRRGAVKLNDSLSHYRTIKNGVPQGGVLSPVLFNLFVANAPEPPENILLLSYADDFVVASKHPKVRTAKDHLQRYISQLDQWFQAKQLQLSPTKSTVTLFTTSAKERAIHPKIKLANQILPLEPHPTVLGVKLDPLLCFKQHMETVKLKATKRMHVLQAVSGTSFGQEKESLLLLYRQLVRTVINYAAPAWFTFAAPSNLKKLQTTQNACLRVATGCVRLSNIDDLHHEAKVLKLEDHLEMISVQALAGISSDRHPLHRLYDNTPQARSLKNSPINYIASKLPPQTLSVTDKATRRKIHQLLATASIERLGPSKLLGRPPPPINPEERSLPRQARTTLARLRTSYHPALNSTKARYHEKQTKICQHCKLDEDETVEHLLFRCEDRQHQRTINNISTLDQLWTDPRMIVKFLEGRTDLVPHTPV